MKNIAVALFLVLILTSCDENSPTGPGPTYDGRYDVTTSADVPGRFLVFKMDVSNNAVLRFDTEYRFDLPCDVRFGDTQRISVSPPEAIDRTGSFSLTTDDEGLSILAMDGTFDRGSVSGRMTIRYYQRGQNGCDVTWPITFSGARI